MLAEDVICVHIYNKSVNYCFTLLLSVLACFVFSFYFVLLFIIIIIIIITVYVQAESVGVK